MSGHRDRRFPLSLIAAFMLAQYCEISCAGELGRLFTTPEERSLLEKLRNPSPVATGQLPLAVDPAIAEQEAGNSDVTVKGYVYRKNGRSTVWLNRSHISAHGVRDRWLRSAMDASDVDDVLIDIPDGKTAIMVRPNKISHPHVAE